MVREMPKTKILIAIDDPEWAKTLVHSAYNLIDAKNAEITLLNVIETTVAEENYFYTEPEKFIEHEAEKSVFAQIENFLENSETNYKGFVYKEGSAADEILKLIKNEGYDLVVLGSHNKNPLERLFLGSVAYKVARASSSSILMINRKSHIKTQESRKFTVLMGVDTSKDSFYAAENLFKFVDKKRAEITLLHVTTEPSLIIPPDAYIYIDLNAIMCEINSASESLLNGIDAELQTTGINAVNKYYLLGEAASTILDEAEKNNHDLIVVGSHGTGNIPRWLLGSVSTKIYEHAKLPVLIIKHR